MTTIIMMYFCCADLSIIDICSLHVFWMLGNATNFVGCRFCIMVCSKLLGAHEVSDSHGSLSLLSMMIMQAWCFVSDSNKVMVAIVVILPSHCWCQDFSGIS
jgi:hypothetical protein